LNHFASNHCLDKTIGLYISVDIHGFLLSVDGAKQYWRPGRDFHLAQSLLSVSIYAHR
jgi:hypothetical protein